MKCNYCGNEIDANSTMCPKCGAPVEETVVEKNETPIEVSKVVEEVKTTNVSGKADLNNQNKKKKNVLVPIIISILVLAAVAVAVWFFVFKEDKESTKNAENTLKSAANKMTKLDNVTMDFNLKMGLNYNGVDGSVEITGNGKLDIKNKIYNLKMSVLGQESEMYGQITDTEVTAYQYDLYSEKWLKTVSEIEESDINDEDKKLLENKLTKNISTTKVESDVDGLTKYKVTLNVKKLFESLKETDIEGLDELNEEYSDEDMPEKIHFYVYVNSDNYIEKIYIDLLELIKDLDVDMEGYDFDDLSITITFSKFNSTGSVAIPSDVIEGAMTEDEFYLTNDFDSTYTEEDIMYDVAISASLYCENMTVDFSNYKGELDEYLDLDEYDVSSITDGVIVIDENCDIVVQKDFTINGKTCTYDDENYESCK